MAEAHETLEGDAAELPVFDTENILWYFGGLTASFAGVAAITQVHPSARGLWILLASLAFLVLFTVVSFGLLAFDWSIPGGVIAATSLVFVAVAAGAFERLIGVLETPQPAGPFEEFEGAIFVVALVTALAGLVLYQVVTFDFVFAYVAAATFLAVQFLVPVFVSHPSPSDHATALLVCGIAFLLLGIAADRTFSRRTGFWWHMIGLVAMSVGFGYHAFERTEAGWVLTLVVFALVLALAVPLQRATWGLFGVVGTYLPLAYYAQKWFGNLGTALSLIVVGMALVGVGIAVHRGDDWAAMLSRSAGA